MGAWIETADTADTSSMQGVAPLVGAWIETWLAVVRSAPAQSRTPRGCVD